MVKRGWQKTSTWTAISPPDEYLVLTPCLVVTYHARAGLMFTPPLYLLECYLIILHPIPIASSRQHAIANITAKNINVFEEEVPRPSSISPKATMPHSTQSPNAPSP